MSKWVQHRSGQGEKWEVYQADPSRLKDLFLCVKDMMMYALPRSEYVECSPPEVWEECTRELVAIEDGHLRSHEVFPFYKNVAYPAGGYRWAWKGDALVVERRQP